MDSTSDEQLVKWIELVEKELCEILTVHYASQVAELQERADQIPALEIGEHRIEAVTFVDE